MPLKIYYLDDEPDLLEMFVDIFSTPEREITAFSDPEKAIAAIKANPPDLFFVDYRLPNYTGDQIAKMLDPKILKVLITGDAWIKCDSQFAAVFEKPYRSSDIEEFIDRFELSRKAA